MLARPTLAIAAIVLSFLMISSLPLASATVAQGFQYQYNAMNKQVTLTTPALDVRVTTGGNVPHFMFWDPTYTDISTRLVYHVQFYQLIEFNDTDDDGLYTNGTDQVVAPILGLARVEWDFSGFTTEEDDGTVTAVHFNFTLTDVQGPGPLYPDLFLQLRCHINTTNDNELKFDIVISGWPWTSTETYLALRWDLMIQIPGAHTYQHAYRYQYENHNYAFDGAYFAYRNQVQVGIDTAPVASCYEDRIDKTVFYLVYANFGDEVLVHDPVVGIDGSVVPPNNLIPLLIVIGAGALACVVIAAAIWTRRRNN